MEQEIRKILRCPICEKGRIADAPAGAALSQYPDALKEKEREEYASLRQFIQNVAVPEMQIKLRQGFGRAIRTESDTCVIAILDERASHGRRYYAAMREALPDMRTTSSLRAVTKFLRELKPESYFEVCA